MLAFYILVRVRPLLPAAMVLSCPGIVQECHALVACAVVSSCPVLLLIVVSNLVLSLRGIHTVGSLFFAFFGAVLFFFTGVPRCDPGAGLRVGLGSNSVFIDR